MSDNSGSVVVGDLSIDSASGQPTLASSSGFKTSSQLTVDTIVEAGHRWEEMGLQLLAVFHQFGRVASVETDFQLLDHAESKHALLERVSIRQVRDQSLTWVHDHSNKSAS